MKKINLIALLAFAVTNAFAQAPNPKIFNTAIGPGLTGFVPYGSAANWQVADALYSAGATPPGGGYITATSLNPAIASWPAPASSADANWIGRTFTCVPGSYDHGCAGGRDQWYKFTFTLNCSQGYCIDLNMWADNCIKEVYVNTTTNTGPGYWLNTVSSINSSNYGTYHGYETQNKVRHTFCDNWQTGTNTIIIHVISNGGTSVGDFAGLLVTANVATSTGTNCVTPPPPPCCLGNYCDDTQRLLTGNYEIPLNGYDFNFSGDNSNVDKVNVGLNCGFSLPGKLNVSSRFATQASTNDSYAIYAQNANSSGSSQNTGVFGSASGTPDGNLLNNRGIWGQARGGDDARGVYGEAHKATLSYGGYFGSVSNNPNGTNIGVYAEAQNGGAPMQGPYGPVTNWAGYFVGDVGVIGTGYITSGFWIASDRKYKDNINELDGTLAKLLKVRSYSYSFRTNEFPKLNFDKRKHYGFIAQELKEQFPELVQENKSGDFVVNYTEMIPVLLDAIKEQQQQIEELKSTVQALAGLSPTKVNTNVVELGNNAIVLNQNVPNPFAESTVISYNIPVDFTSAEIIFTTSDGIVIKKLAITQKGKGQLTVYANDLTHGAYNYALVVDGKTIDSKLMIKQ